jgi:autophagy-related protein 5
MAESEAQLPAPPPALEAVEAKIGECILTDGFPVSFALAPDEVTATAQGGELEAPRPYIGHLSRQAYLPLVFDRLREHFSDSMPPQCTGDVWCSTEDGTPLKWHRPSGVLFDLHGTPEELPWRLVVHFTKFPQAQVSAGSRPPRNSARPPALAKLPTCAARLTPALTRAYLLRQLLSPCGKRDVQWHFMNTVKEAIFLRYGSTQPLTSLAIEQQTQMWESLMDEDVRKFSDVAAAIRPSDVKHIPLRILVPGRPAAVQAPVTPTDQDGARPPPPRTLPAPFQPLCRR